MITNSETSRDIFSINYEPKLYSYINYLDTYRNDMYNHAAIIIVLVIMYSTLGSSIDVLCRWIGCITAIIGFIYSIMSGVYLFKVIRSWDISIRLGLMKFWNLCTQLSIKNYRLIREYREVYQHHYGDIKMRCSDKFSTVNHKESFSTSKQEQYQDAELKKYIDYVIKNDISEKMESCDWIRLAVERINQYVRLSYYLSFIEPEDCLELRQDNIYINVGTQSVMNKRNRKLESVINEIPLNYKHELVNAWINLDKRQSDKMLIIIPCKWIMYEYRNMFRYLHCAKYFKNIYASFDKDYSEIESTVYVLCSVLQDIFRRDIIYLPVSFLSIFNMITDTLLIILDNFIAINIVSCFFTSGAIIVPLIMSCIIHVIVCCVILAISKSLDDIKNPLKECTDLENIDHNIETIFNEMKVILFDGNIKRAF